MWRIRFIVLIRQLAPLMALVILMSFVGNWLARIQISRKAEVVSVPITRGVPWNLACTDRALYVVASSEANIGELCRIGLNNERVVSIPFVATMASLATFRGKSGVYVSLGMELLRYDEDDQRITTIHRGKVKMRDICLKSNGDVIALCEEQDPEYLSCYLTIVSASGDLRNLDIAVRGCPRNVRVSDDGALIAFSDSLSTCIVSIEGAGRVERKDFGSRLVAPVSWFPNSRQLAVGGDCLSFWDTESKEVRSLDVGGRVGSVDVLHDGQTVYAVVHDGGKSFVAKIDVGTGLVQNRFFDLGGVRLVVGIDNNRFAVLRVSDVAIVTEN